MTAWKPRRRAQSLLDLQPLRRGPGAGWSRLLAETPDDADLHGIRAQALLGLDEPALALEAGNQVVALTPDDEWGHRICAVALAGWARTRSRGRRGHGRAPGPLAWQTHQQYAISAMAVPGPDARTPGRRRTGRSSSVPNQPGAHFAVGAVADALRQYDVARAAYQRMLALDPNHAAALNNLTLLGPQLKLARAAHGYASVLRNDPDNEAARANIDALAFRFVRRVYWAALIALVVGLAAALAPTGDAEVTAVTICIGCGLLVGVVAYTVSLSRAIPVGVHRFVRRRLVTDRFLLATSLLTVGMLATGLAVCLVPGAAIVGAAMLRPLGLLNVALFVWAVARQNS